jgi:hypothetical protein
MAALPARHSQPEFACRATALALSHPARLPHQSAVSHIRHERIHRGQWAGTVHSSRRRPASASLQVCLVDTIPRRPCDHRIEQRVYSWNTADVSAQPLPVSEHWSRCVATLRLQAAPCLMILSDRFAAIKIGARRRQRVMLRTVPLAFSPCTAIDFLSSARVQGARSMARVPSVPSYRKPV